MLLVSFSYSKFSSTQKRLVKLRLFSVGGKTIKLLVAGVSSKKVGTVNKSTGLGKFLSSSNRTG